jgi:hypothetical protein
MDDIKLKTANQLIADIKKAKENLTAWKTCKKFTSVGPNIEYMDEQHRNCAAYIPCSPETLKVMQALNVVFWQDALDALEKEFSEL